MAPRRLFLGTLVTQQSTRDIHAYGSVLDVLEGEVGLLEEIN